MNPFYSILIGLAIFALTLFLDVRSDFKLWLKGIGVKHFRGALIRLIGLIPAMFFIGWLPFHHSWILVAVCSFFFFAYWTLFDGLYSNKRRRNWWDTGSNDPDDAQTDNFLQKLSLTKIKLVKIGGMAVSAAIFLILYL